MKLYFFKSIQGDYASEFLALNRVQNIRVMNAFAVVVLFFTILNRVFILSANNYQLGLKYAMHLEINAFFIITGCIFSVLLFWLYKNKATLSVAGNMVAHIYSLIFFGGNIWLSFVAQHNPSNTMTLLLIGMFCVSATTVFSIRQVVISMVVCAIIFRSGLGFFQTDFELRAFNYLVFATVLVCFYIISRLTYSFHANYFIKVKIIEEKNKQIEVTDHSKNEILGIVAHDLRSPVANIQSLVELMELENTTQEEIKAYMNHIKTCCSKAEMIIREIIIAAREESNDVLKTEKINMNRFLSDTQKSLQRLVNGNHTIKLELPNHEVIAMVNKEKLQRVIDNLLNNAVKFTPKNGTISLSLESDSTSLRLCVKDTGIGIPKEQLPFLFDKFTSTGRVGLNQESSVGLGLHISKQLVEKHGGSIDVESIENQGTTFCITLPKQV
jgi:signal transduction histidine kinase